MRQAGKMDRVLTIQRLTAGAPDTYGVPTETWTDLVTLRAVKLEGVAADTEHSGIAITDTRVKLQTWFYSGLTLEDRATYEGATYQIKYLSEIGRRRGLEIHIELLGVPGALGDQ
jgi:head-tail adaptor